MVVSHSTRPTLSAKELVERYAHDPVVEARVRFYLGALRDLDPRPLQEVLLPATNGSAVVTTANAAGGRAFFKGTGGQEGGRDSLMFKRVPCLLAREDV